MDKSSQGIRKSLEIMDKSLGEMQKSDEGTGE